MEKKLFVVTALCVMVCLLAAGCITVVMKNNDTDMHNLNETNLHYPTLTKVASSDNATVVITYPASIYPLKVSVSDGVRWRWSWKIQFAEVNGTAVTINCVNHFVSSSGVLYGALGQEPGFSNVSVAGKETYEYVNWTDTAINSPLIGTLVFKCWGTDQYGQPLKARESNTSQALESNESIVVEVTVWPPKV